MDIFKCIKENDIVLLKALLLPSTDSDNAEINQVNQVLDGMAPLHYAAYIGNLDILDILLGQHNIIVNIQDREGNTALHIAAAASEIEAVRMLLASNADVHVINNSGKRPIDYAENSTIRSMLADRMASEYQTSTIDMNTLRELQTELPNDVELLKMFIVELVIDQHNFQEKCKETLHQLIEEKHIVQHKCHLLELAAGIKDRATGDSFMNQLSYLQDENERQTATIAYLKIQNRMLDQAAAQQEEFYRKNLGTMMEQHTEGLQAILKRNEQSELAFLEYQNKMSKDLEDLARLRAENILLKTRLQQKGGLPVNDALIASLSEEKLVCELKLQSLTENSVLKDIAAEKLALAEKVKESLKETEKMRTADDANKLRRAGHDEKMALIRREREKQEEQDESQGLIVFIRGENNSKELKGATPEKLVERLTDGSTLDNQFMRSFLLTFRDFMDKYKLLDLVIARFKATPTDEFMDFQSPIHLRVCNTLKYWMENYWYDFENDDKMLGTMNKFVEDVKKSSQKLASILENILHRKLNRLIEPVVETSRVTKACPKPILPKGLVRRITDASQASAAAAILNTIPPPALPGALDRQPSARSNSTHMLVTSPSMAQISISPSPNNQAKTVTNNWPGFPFVRKLDTADLKPSDAIKLRFIDLDPIEVARQLTLIEHQLFCSIQSTELMNQAWMKPEKETKAPNICRMTQWSNHIVHWTITEIVTVRESVKARANIFERLVMVGQNLEKLNNFNGIKEILAGLQSSAVYRLKKTREAVGSKYLKILEDLSKITSSELNFKNLRAKIHAADPPLIPFPGIYQGDLVFLDTCSRNVLDGGLIHFQKYQKIASYIEDFQSFQRSPYNLEPVVEIQEYFKNYQVLEDDAAYNLSLLCEPRTVS